ncbi:MAG: putative glycosyltransferase [Sphingobacteriaceae bacterium]|jgi:GT2 family glycosyltransferase|nr:putative glycosyltransferase [Sphingobacteriaceae bacterium]
MINTPAKNGAWPKVSVVILNWNGRHLLEEFLPSVFESTYPNLEIVVGDNASTDESLSFVRENYPSAKTIQNHENLGFAGGYNEVLKQVNADYFVLLNSDVEVETGWIEPVIQMMDADKAIAAAQPKIRWYKQKHLFEYAGAAGGFIDKYGYPFCRGRIFDTVEADEGQYDDETEIFWASGAALFIRRSCWEEAKGLDADFFAHMEEIDLCWRLKNLGYKIKYCPGSVVYHLGAGTLNAESPHKTYLNFRNNLAMLAKNLPAGKAFRVIFIRFWLDFISLLRFGLQGKSSSAAAISKAHTHFFRDLRRNRRKAGEGNPNFNNAGVYNSSIVWAYFAKGKKTFLEL